MHETTASSPVVEAMLDGVIDYAGLFPPAGLSMEDAVRGWAAALAGPDAWMLARFLCPVDRLDEFEQAAEGHLPTDPDSEPWGLAVLLPPAGDAAFPAAIDCTVAFNAAHAGPRRGRAVADVVEFPAQNPARIEEALGMLPDELFAFVELPLDEDVRGLLTALADAGIGAKVRTGGVEASLYPSTEALAAFVRCCALSAQPFKATSGLHHPLRHQHESLGVDEFGFLGLLLASTMARFGGADERDVATMLDLADLGSVTIEPESIRWNDRSITLEQIVETRTELFCSFGSCSVDEPIEGLRALDLLHRPGEPCRA